MLVLKFTALVRTAWYERVKWSARQDKIPKFEIQVYDQVLTHILLASRRLPLSKRDSNAKVGGIQPGLILLVISWELAAIASSIAAVHRGLHSESKTTRDWPQAAFIVGSWSCVRLCERNLAACLEMASNESGQTKHECIRALGNKQWCHDRLYVSLAV